MRTTLCLFALLTAACACTYNPPPDVSLGGPADRRYDVGELIPILFTEPVEAASLELAVWPNENSAYDAEGRRLPASLPLLASCTLAKSPCGDGADVGLTLDEARTTATLDVPPGAFGNPGRPLVLEIKGTLADADGRKLNVVRSLPFQIIEPLGPIDDTVAETGAETDVATEPFVINEGPHLYFSDIATPVGFSLAQQFFCDLQADEATGDWIAVLTDADPITGAEKNTTNPAELFLDTGAQGFIFTAHGKITRDAQGLIFKSEPFTLELTIVSITFALREAVIQGRITVDAETGLSSWDGQMSIESLYYKTPSLEKVYTEADGLEPAAFQIFQLKPEQVPDGLPRVCDADPCPEGIQQCNLVDGIAWPPASMCE